MEINNDIQETLVNFEVAKLIKEKGFDIWTYSGWKENKVTSAFKEYTFDYNRPTHQLVFDWIYKNFKIYIGIEPYNKYWSIKIFQENKDPFKVGSLLRDGTELRSVGQFNFLEVKDEAIKYCLTNLIL